MTTTSMATISQPTAGTTRPVWRMRRVLTWNVLLMKKKKKEKRKSRSR
jgi:hypothetical protein